MLISRIPKLVRGVIMGADTYNDDIKRVTFFVVFWAVFLPNSRSTLGLAGVSGRKLVEVNLPLGMVGGQFNIGRSIDTLSIQRRRYMPLPKEVLSCTT